MGAMSSALGLLFVRTIKFLTPWLSQSLKYWQPLAFLESSGQKWSPGFSTGHSGMVFHSQVGATRLLLAPVGKHIFITWRTLPLASKKDETAELLTWRTTAMVRMQRFQCPSAKAAFSLLFSFFWGLQLPNHPKCQQRPEASLGQVFPLAGPQQCPGAALSYLAPCTFP